MACAQIHLQQLEFHVFLGWGNQEREKQQKIHIDIHIQFSEPPAACVSDELDDTFCYDALNQTLKKQIEIKPFKLLEHLGYETYSIIKDFLKNPKNKIAICVTKYPDSFFKSKGVSFWYGDKEVLI